MTSLASHHLGLFSCIVCFYGAPAQHEISSLTLGRWTVSLTDVGNITAISAEGADFTLKGSGMCPGVQSPAHLHGQNAPVLINARTGDIFACAYAARCEAPAPSAARVSFCYDFGTTFGMGVRVRVLYNVSICEGSGGGEGFSLLQDVGLNVSGDDTDLVLILQLPFPIQPNKLVEDVNFVESKLVDGRPFMRQVAGVGAEGPWGGEFSMSESAFAIAAESATGCKHPFPFKSLSDMSNQSICYSKKQWAKREKGPCGSWCELIPGASRACSIGNTTEPPSRLCPWVAKYGRLALPIVVSSAPGVKLRAVHVADPFYSTAFKLAGSRAGDGCWQSVYNSSRSSLNGSGIPKVVRHFATVVHNDHHDWANNVDAWYQAVLPHVRKPPEWIRNVGLSHFDFFTLNGSAWRRDIDWLSHHLSVPERGRVVIAQEGWYDKAGDYSFDTDRNKFAEHWTFAPGSPFWDPDINGSGGWNCSVTHRSCDAHGNPTIWKLNMTVDKVRKNLHYARSQGFRVLLYFGDGLLVCKTAKTYNPEYTLPDSLFPRMTTHMADCDAPANVKFSYSVQNPLRPEVSGRYVKYLKSLLRAFGDVIDGFVWDETYFITPDFDMIDAAGGYAATAMLRLIRQLTDIVYDYDPQMVFMASDLPSASYENLQNGRQMVPYGVLTSGQFPDFEAVTEFWPAYFATLGTRSVVWTANWDPRKLLAKSVAATYAYNAPPSLGMCWHTSQFPNVGIAGMPQNDSDTILRLFRRVIARDQVSSSVYI